MFDYSYELDNGQIFSEQGELRTIGDQQAVVKSGAYSFVSPDGVVHWVTYTADENGFHPVVGKETLFRNNEISECHKMIVDIVS